MLTPQVPYPPRQGTALRNWGLLKGLSEHHSVSLLTFASSDQTTVPDPVLSARSVWIEIIPQPERSTWDRLRDLVLTRKPDLVQRLISADFAQALERRLRTHAFDWIMVEGLEMAPYLDVLPAGPRPGVIFDDHNCEYLLQRRAAQSERAGAADWARAAYSAVQWRRLRCYEAAVCRRAELVIAVSEQDAAALRAIEPGLAPLVIPNGIDVDAYAGFDEAADLAQPAFVFTGTMDFRPNVDGVLWFADKVWPQVRATLPTATFYIVGRHPHARLERLRSVPGVVVTGGVPETRPYIRAAAVYVVPLLVGGGTRLKLLESTAMGKAIVATHLAAEGFAEAGSAMVLADTPDAFAAACMTLARDPVERGAWGRRARAFAEAYDWDALLPRLLGRLGEGESKVGS
jgi:polysaccharide biosynthesis protein PslH